MLYIISFLCLKSDNAKLETWHVCSLVQSRLEHGTEVSKFKTGRRGGILGSCAFFCAANDARHYYQTVFDCRVCGVEITELKFELQQVCLSMVVDGGEWVNETSLRRPFRPCP